MPSGAIITTLGLAKLASATPLNQLNISALAVGDGNGGYPTLNPSMTSLTNEVWRGAPSPPIRDPNSPNVLIFEAVIPPSVGGFTVREQAIFDDAGDMIAIGQTSVVEKPLPNAATGVMLTVRLHVQLDNAEQVDLFFQDDPTISAGNVSNANGGSVQDFIDDQDMFYDSLVPFRVYPESGVCSIGDTIPVSPVYGGVRTSFGEYQANQALSGVITAISESSITVGGVDFELTILSNVFAKRIEAPYVIAVTKSLLQEAVDKAVASTKPYPQINGATNSGSIVIDLGGSAVVIDRPIELPAGAGGYTFANGLIAPDVSNFPVGESLIEYVGVGDHPLIGFFNLQLECARIANGMYVNRYIENWATGLRIHGQKDWGIRIGSDLGFEFNTGTGCAIAEYYNNEAGFLAPTSTGLLIDVGGAADNIFNALVIKYCKKQFDIGSQANKFNGCHFYGTGADQYNSNGRSVIRGNAKRNQFNGSYFDTTGLEIQNPSQMQILGGRFAAASSVNGSSYVHLNAITANHNLDALLIRDNIFAIIGNYQADAFSWTGTIGRIRDTDVSNNSVDLQGGVGDSPSIDMRSTKAFKRVFGSGVNTLSAQFNNVLLWDANIQRIIGLTAEMSNIQPYSVATSGRNVNLSLPASQFSNITLRTTVDVSSHYSETADQYPL